MSIHFCYQADCSGGKGQLPRRSSLQLKMPVTLVARYISNTKIKFFLVLGDPVPKDEELRMVRPLMQRDAFQDFMGPPNALAVMQIFKRFHAAYVDAVSNPFYTINTVSQTNGSFTLRCLPGYLLRRPQWIQCLFCAAYQEQKL